MCQIESVNELAVLAKADSTIIPQLWGKVERLIKTVCMKYSRQDNRLYDMDDLCQSAYFGFLQAIKTYDPERGAFSTLLVFYVRQTCSKEVGQRGKRDVLFDSDSLYAPISDGLTYADLLPVEEGETPVDVAAMAATVLKLADGLLDKRKGVIIREHTYQGKPINDLVERFGISRQWVNNLEYSAIQDLRRMKPIRDMRSEYLETTREIATNPHKKKSAATFKSDFTSVVESIVMRL